MKCLVRLRILLFIITIAVNFSFAQNISYFKLPKQYRLYPRDESDNDSSVVNISGYIVGTGYDKISVEITRNSNFWREVTQNLSYNGGDTAFFDLNPKIYAGLIEFGFEIKFSSGSSTITNSIIDSVVCGDVYLIQGQSNAQSADYGGFVPYKAEWVRSFGTTTSKSGNDTSGVQATTLDTTWDLAQAKAIHCHAAIGIWGLRLGRQISELHNIPVCIINGSPGGSEIKSHKRENDPFDLTSIYGRLLWRVYAAGVQNNVKALIWWQGESDSGGEGDAEQYFIRFLNLVSDWRLDYPGIQKIYITQIHVGYDDGAGYLRETQRQIALLDNDIEILNGNDIGGFVEDGSHFHPSGYEKFAGRVLYQIGRDFYGDPDTDINPANINNAYFTNTHKNVIVLDFTEVETLVWQNDTIIYGSTRRLKDYFYFHNADATIDSNIVDNGIVFGNFLRLALNKASSATSISYLPHMYYNGSDTLYEGPWLKNSRNIPALSFFEFPADGVFGPDPAHAPNGIIDIPVDDTTFIIVGDSVEFSGTGSSPDLLQLSYEWEFGTGSGIPNSTSEDPGFVGFDSSGVFKITFIVTDELGIKDPSPDTRIIQVARRELVPQAYWSLIFVDSEEKIATNGAAINAFDGDSTTFWFTEYDTAEPPHPHEIQIDMNFSYDINSFSYLPRQDGRSTGMVEDYEFYVSEDSTNWGSPVVTGIFLESIDGKQVNFISKRGRFIRFRALSETSSDPWTTMAELNVYADTVFSNLPPNGFINLPTNSLEIIVGDSVEFAGTGNDANGHYPLTYLWEFGTGSGIPNSNVEDPGFVKFNIPGNFTVRFTVIDSQGLPDPTPDIRNIKVIRQHIIGKSEWSLIYVDSEELNSSGDIGPAANGFDGDPNTIWHTEWINADPDLPHEIQIDLGANYFLAGFNYLPRQDGSDVGTIKDYEFYVSMDNTNWGTPVASGRFAENTQEKNVSFSPKHGRYIRLRALLEVDGEPYTSMAEIDIVAQDEPLPVQLSTFEGEFLYGKISLKWKTESELNNLGFIILRKKLQEEQFQEIDSYRNLASLLGNGTTYQAAEYNYLDKNIQVGETYLYILENVDFYGNIEGHGPITVETHPMSSIPGYRLYQNYPNPFNSTTKIPYYLPGDNFTSITLYDLLGRKIRTLLSGKKHAGYHELIFQPENLKTGLYFYKIQMGNYQAVKQMLLVR